MSDGAQQGGRAPVFLVDGDSAGLSDLGAILEAAGYLVRHFTSGEEALEAARADEVLALVTEYKLSEVGGIQLIAALREAKPLVPAFMVSGSADSEGAIRAVQAGACDFLPKPVDAEEFVGLLEEALEGVRRWRRGW